MIEPAAVAAAAMRNWSPQRRKHFGTLKRRNSLNASRFVTTDPDLRDEIPLYSRCRHLDFLRHLGRERRRVALLEMALVVWAEGQEALAARTRPYLFCIDLQEFDDALPSPYFNFCGSHVALAVRLLSPLYGTKEQPRWVLRALDNLGLLRHAVLRVARDLPQGAGNAVLIDFVVAARGKRVLGAKVGIK